MTGTKYGFYRGYTLKFCKCFQGTLQMNKKFQDQRRVFVGYWMIIKDGKRIDSALSYEKAKNRINMILQPVDSLSIYGAASARIDEIYQQQVSS
jgi:hypothetical protein